MIFRTSQRTWQLACSNWYAAKYSLSVQPKFSWQFACAGLAATTAERALKATESKANWMRMGDLHR
jgi:hypothetical protein